MTEITFYMLYYTKSIKTDIDNILTSYFLRETIAHAKILLKYYYQILINIIKLISKISNIGITTANNL